MRFGAWLIGGAVAAAFTVLGGLQAQERGLQSFRDCSVCPEMVELPAGRFLMGSPRNEWGRGDNEGPTHWVDVEPFAIGKYEVTLREWRAFTGDTRGFSGRGVVLPASYVSWHDAQKYVQWLSHNLGYDYRLPTEAEWEYAARAGTTTAHYWGESVESWHLYANFVGRGDGFVEAAPVGSFGPNKFGLHDMSGNVGEWVQDCYHRNYSGAPGDGRAWEGENCTTGVVRGGGYRNGGAHFPRSAVRTAAVRSYSRMDIGWRVAKTLDAP